MTYVDRHIIPFKRMDYPLRLDPTNLTSLACKFPIKGFSGKVSHRSVRKTIVCG
jgi:hypothetical protein